MNRWVGALCLVLGFGALFVGRVIMYPTALVRGTLLERIRAETGAWDWSHRVMLAGFVVIVPGVVALWERLRGRSRWVSGIGAWLLISAIVLMVGQFALDFAYMQAALALSPEAGQQFVDAMRADSFVRRAFYESSFFAGVGALLLVLAMFRQGRAWWYAGGVVAAAVLLSLVDSRMGPIGPRVTLGAQWVGFSLAAWRLVREGRAVGADAQDLFKNG